MNTKGNIGQVVYIPVTISEIKITKTGTTYTCDFPKDGICQQYKESELRFIGESEAPKEEKPKATKKTAPKLTATKRRGRPRKATVEDLINSANDQKNTAIRATISKFATDALAESKEGGEAI